MRGASGLVGKSLEPEDPCKRAESHHSLVNLNPNQRRPLIRREIATEHALDVVSRSLAEPRFAPECAHR